MKSYKIATRANKLFASIYEKNGIKKSKNFGVFNEELKNTKKQILKNLARIFSAKISIGSKEDPSLANNLDGERFKGIYKQILDVYELAMEIAMDKNPYERPNFSDKLINFETLGKSWDELDNVEKEIINTYINTFHLDENKKQTYQRM